MYRYIMLRNSSGFYSYAIFEHLKEWPAFNIPQIRMVFKLKKDKYGLVTLSYIYIDIYTLNLLYFPT